MTCWDSWFINKKIKPMGLKPFGVSVLAPGTRVAETAGTKHQDKLKLLKLGNPGLFFFKGYCTKSTDCSRVWPKMGVSTWGLVEAQHEPDTGTAPQKFLGKCRYCRRVSSWKQSCDHTSAGQCCWGCSHAWGFFAALPCSTDNS